MRPGRIRPSTLLSLRAAGCLSVPLVVGVATGHVHQATLFSLGGLWGVSQDGLDAWPVRSRRLLDVALATFVGFAIGGVIGIWGGTSVTRVALLGGMGLICGFIQASGLASVGAYALLATVVGSGIVTSSSMWWLPLATSLGALWVWAVAATMDRRSRHAVLRACIADAFKALDRAIVSIGHDDVLAVRSEALRALDVAQDAVGTRRPRQHVAEGIAIRQCLLIAFHCGELVSFLASTTSAPPRICELSEVEQALRTSSATSALETLARRSTDRRGVHRGEQIAMALEIPAPERAARWSPRPIERFRAPVRERLRFGVLLGASIAASAAVALMLRGPHRFWLPMSVAFIMRPDLGPVVGRALARTVGTVIGVGLAGVMALVGNPPAGLIGLVCVMAVLMPGATRRGHIYAVMTFTPIVFVFIAMTGNDRGLFVPRLVDTALAAVIVLGVDMAAWTTSPSLRPRAQLTRARSAVAAYLRCEPNLSLGDRAFARRAAFRAIAAASGAVAMASREPAFLRRRDPETLEAASELLVDVDRHTAELVRAGET